MPTEQTALRTTTEIVFTQEELDALKKEYASQASPEQFTLWIAECKRRGLVPQRDVVLQIRAVKEWDQESKQKIFKKKAVYITTIQALRKLAERTGKYAGQLPSMWVYLDGDGNPSIESDVPLPETNSTQLPRRPWAAKASVERTGFKHPITVPARFEAYAQYFSTDGGQKLNNTWENRGPEQLEKCAEALALRKAFPEELGGLYLQEEMTDETVIEQTQPTTEPTASPEKKKAGRPKKTDVQFGANSADTGGAPKTDGAPTETAPAPSGVINTHIDGTLDEFHGHIKFQTSANQQTEAAAPVQTGAATVAASDNIHGLDITDNDLPGNLQPSRPPTEAEQKKFYDRCIKMKKDGLPGDKIRAYILNQSGAKTGQEITFQQWENIMAKFDEAEKAGKLKELFG